MTKEEAAMTLEMLPVTEAAAGIDRPAGEGPLTVLVPCDATYDTAAEVGRAIRCAAPVLQGQRLLVLVLWRSITPAASMAHAALPAAMVATAALNRDGEERERARRWGQQCVAIAQECGVDAAYQVRLVKGAWATSVAAIADAHGADVIVLPDARRARRLSRLLARRRGNAASAPMLLVAAGRP